MQAATVIGQIQSIVAQAHHTPDSGALLEIFCDRLEQANKLQLLAPACHNCLGCLHTEDLPVGYTLALVDAYAQAGNFYGAARHLYREGAHITRTLALIKEKPTEIYPAHWHATQARQESRDKLHYRAQQLLDSSCELALHTAGHNQIPAARALLCSACLGLPQQQISLVGLHSLTIDELKEKQNPDGIRALLRAATQCSKKLPAPNYLSTFLTNQYLDCLHILGQQTTNMIGLPPPDED